jgi:hypothetical protein
VGRQSGPALRSIGDAPQQITLTQQHAPGNPEARHDMPIYSVKIPDAIPQFPVPDKYCFTEEVIDYANNLTAIHNRDKSATLKIYISASIIPVKAEIQTFMWSVTP